MRPLRFSPTTLLVLERFVTAPSHWHHGYSLIHDLGLSSGTLYPVLMRLAESGWLERRWETPLREGRPPRHLYRLAHGAAPEARALLREWSLRDLKHRAPKPAT